MKTAGIVAEFDPFHNGHEYLVRCARENGAEAVVCVMSGSFMQRGECAVMGKFERAKAAVLGGADIVFELPQVFACASAERFAFGAVETLRACGIVDTLCFGSECGSAETLAEAERLTRELDISPYLKEGFTHARAVEAAARAAGFDEAARLVSQPNNTLAVEYIRAAKGCFGLFTSKRTAPHSAGQTGIYTSASEIRRMIAGHEDFGKYVPETTAGIISQAMSEGRCPVFLENNERGVLTVLRRMTTDELSCLPDVSEGLENRLYRAIRSENTVSGIIMAAKCKRYTYARLARIIACAYLGIKKSDVKRPLYIRVLAFDETGAKLLREMKTKASLPVVMNARDIKSLDGEAARMIDIDIKAADMLALCMPQTAGCSEDYYRGALYLPVSK